MLILAGTRRRARRVPVCAPSVYDPGLDVEISDAVRRAAVESQLHGESGHG